MKKTSPSLVKLQEIDKRIARSSSLWKKLSKKPKETQQRQTKLLWVVEEVAAMQRQLDEMPVPAPHRKEIEAREKEFKRHLETVYRIWTEHKTAFLTALEAGNQEPFFEALKLYGGTLILEPYVGEVISRKRVSALQDKKDRAFLRRLKAEISFIGGGRRQERSSEKVKEDNTLDKRFHRTEMYYQKALNQLQEGIKELTDAGNLNKKEVQKLVFRINNKEFSRETVAKREACQRYKQEVKRILPTLLTPRSCNSP